MFKRFINRIQSRLNVKYLAGTENVLKNLGIFSIALIIIISGTGLKISIHTCQNEIYDIGVLSHADNCMLEHNHQKHSCCTTKEEDTKHSCKDENINFKKVDNYLLTDINFEYKTNINDFNLVFENFNFNDFSENNAFLNHDVSNDISPPDIGTFLAQLQVFII